MTYGYDEANDQKANFDDVYNRPTPVPYFSAMREVGYEIPQNAKPLFGALIEQLRQRRGRRTVGVLDLGCSYGISAALLKYGLSIEQLYDHYERVRHSGIERDTLLAKDRAWLGRLERRGDIRIYGVDVAGEAVRYAVASGLLDAGVAADLEAEPCPQAKEIPEAIDLVISTGCVGYVTERSFHRLLDRTMRPAPWIASFVLRMFDYGPIEEALAARGMVTEKLRGRSFAQRRFLSGEEKRHAIDQVTGLGRDPAGLESRGRYYADFYLSRPAEEAARVALPQLLGAVVQPRGAQHEERRPSA
jgi:SAM-dependent methyltransferase